MKLERFDDLVLTVPSIAATSAFCRDVLGTEVVTSGEGRIALGLGTQKINLHEVGREGRMVAARPTSGSGDLCFITTRPLPEWTERLRAACVRAVDFEAGRRLCTPDLIAFGTVAHFVEGIDRVTEQQWRGTTFSRPGRLTIAFEKRDGRWLARHTHFSLSPAPA